MERKIIGSVDKINSLCKSKFKKIMFNIAVSIAPENTLREQPTKIVLKYLSKQKAEKIYKITRSMEYEKEIAILKELSISKIYHILWQYYRLNGEYGFIERLKSLPITKAYMICKRMEFYCFNVRDISKSVLISMGDRLIKHILKTKKDYEILDLDKFSLKDGNILGLILEQAHSNKSDEIDFGISTIQCIRIRGILYKSIKGYFNRYIDSGILAKDQKVNGVWYKKDTKIEYRGAMVVKGTLAKDQKVNGIWYEKDSEIEYKGAMVTSGKLVKDVKIDGVVYEGSNYIEYHFNGKVKEGLMGENLCWKLKNILFSASSVSVEKHLRYFCPGCTYIKFDEKGHILETFHWAKNTDGSWE